MKVAVIIEYLQDREKIKAIHAEHRVYLRQFLENGKLFAVGPFDGNAGSLWILEVTTEEEAENIVKGDPYVATGVFVSWKTRPLAYWSAKESKGK